MIRRDLELYALLGVELKAEYPRYKYVAYTLSRSVPDC